MPRFWYRWRASLERAWGRLWLLKSLKLNRRAQLLFHQSHECSRDRYSLYRYRYQNQTLEVGYCCNYEFQPIVNPCLTLTSHQLPLSTQHAPPSLLTLNGAQYNKLCPDLLLSWNFQDTSTAAATFSFEVICIIRKRTQGQNEQKFNAHHKDKMSKS